MFHISDSEMGLAAAMSNRIRQNTSAAQRIVDRKNVELGRLMQRVAQLERENAALKAERGQRNTAAFAAHLARH